METLKALLDKTYITGILCHITITILLITV